MRGARVVVDVEVLASAAAVIESVGEELAESLSGLWRQGAPGPPLDPARWGVWARATEASAQAAARHGVLAVAVRELGIRVRAAARVYRMAEDALRESLRQVIRAASRVDLLDEVGASARLSAVDPGVAPVSTASALDEVAQLSAASDGRVRVVGWPQEDGSMTWLVLVPGTQEWDPRAGGNPFDVTTDLVEMADEMSVLAGGAAAALALAQQDAGRAGLGDPVMLVGHSLGGIVAAGLAADPAFRARFTVTDVVTTGSPVALADVPRSVRTLSLEHTDDVIPKLDLAGNPQRAGWVTLRTAAPAGSGSPHDCTAYAQTMRSATALGLVDTRLHGPFLSGAGPPRITEVRIERVWPGPDAGAGARERWQNRGL